MRFALLLIPLLLFGCISFGERMINDTNQTAENGSVAVLPENATDNQTANQSEPIQKTAERFYFSAFSFEHPANMSVQKSTGSSGGIFTGTHELDGQTGEILVVSYIDTEAVFGANKNEIFRDNPSKAASDFLLEDKKSDSAGSLLSGAYEVGGIKTFTVARDGAVAEAQFRIRFSGGNKSYYGYAMDIYVPERSLHSKVRVVALDSDKAKEIRDNFLLSFRIE